MSLKEANKKTLWIVVFANLVAFGVVTNVPQPSRSISPAP